jgi:glycosyltransferase involved in cell wall biosynthesis
MRAGPSLAKPLADLGLAMTLRDAIGLRAASKHGLKTAADHYDAILTHNAEACVIALTSLPAVRPAVVYCVHTLLGQELSTYLAPPLSSPGESFSPSESGTYRLSGTLRRASKRRLDAVGTGIDRQLARRVDGWIALTHDSDRVMRHDSEAPGALIPPPLPDPLADPMRLDPKATAETHGLEPGRYFLYSGNLDPYQELGVLLEAARRRRVRVGVGGSRDVSLVVATHDARAERLSGPLAEAGIRLIRVAGTTTRSLAREPERGAASEPRAGCEGGCDAGVAEMQALIAGARGTLCLRRALGGFPIKLANSLALGTPPIAYHAHEWGLEHGVSAWIASPEDPVASLTGAIDRITRDDALAERLRRGARALYRSQHDPVRVAARTLELLERVLEKQTRRGSLPW